MAAGGGGLVQGSGSGLMGQSNKRVAFSSPGSKPFESFFLSGSSPSFLGSRGMFSFEENNGGKGSGRTLFNSYDQEEFGDDEFDYFQQPEKKRRLKADQVQFLEKSFETENKLEPERKTQLAKELGLQPRQIAIWFQNRRARWKTKQLEKDYDLLQDSYNQLRANYDNLLKEKDELKAEVLHLSGKLLRNERENDSSASFDTQSSAEVMYQENNANLAYKVEVFKDSMLGSMQNDNEFVKSDSGSPRVHDTSYICELEQRSDASQDEDNFSDELLPSHAYTMYTNNEEDYHASPENSFQFGVPDDVQSLGFWSY